MALSYGNTDRFYEHDGPVRGVHFHKAQSCLCLEVIQLAWIFIASFFGPCGPFFCISGLRRILKLITKV